MKMEQKQVRFACDKDTHNEKDSACVRTNTSASFTTPMRQQSKDHYVGSEIMILQKAVSYLETKLCSINEEREESLLQIEEEKKRTMARIHQKHVAEKVIQRWEDKQEEESSAHDVDVIHETIELAREANRLLRQQNNELIEEMDIMAYENELLAKRIENWHCASAKLRQEIADAETLNHELYGAIEFLKTRKHEYEQARLEADIDIELEKECKAQEKYKVEKILLTLQSRYSESGVVDAIHDATNNEISRMKASSRRATTRRVTCV
jgi:hypothetical protein